MSLGTIPDIMFDPALNGYQPMVFDLNGVSETLTGEWNSTQTILPEHSMTVQLPAACAAELTENVTVLLSMAVEFGNVGFTGEPVEVKYAKKYWQLGEAD